jgi:hypothetical protein
VERTDSDVDRFLSGLDDESRPDMVALDALISDVMAAGPRELYEGRFWGGSDQRIIGYGRMSSPRSDGSSVEWFVIGLARQKQAISVYVSAVEDGRYLAEARGAEVGKVKVGKSVIGFRSLSEIDTTKLRALLERARDIAED